MKPDAVRGVTYDAVAEAGEKTGLTRISHQSRGETVRPTEEGGRTMPTPTRKASETVRRELASGERGVFSIRRGSSSELDAVAVGRCDVAAGEW